MGSIVLRVDTLKVAPLPPLSFSVANGECLAVEGPSGSGKTRLLRAIADLDPAEGHVFLDGAEKNEMPAPEWRKRVRYACAERPGGPRRRGPRSASPRANHPKGCCAI
jgi:ABC-type iron transport system FetAB ATPase subunit